ncbi:exodeoxyribonuclease VII, small subunit [Leptospira inadai serovar Lyme str. 10]|uniref:Exodeoxyribonuclease 7 small subunit n=2 Tax=Leptospira inadai serovar Lyme TaxID=293084 RepID=V6HF03_9LEPT|nr:exodeoxyribonuclease VII small subunit [Leptospira inadai]EQA38053.1 exodeoxyribonuclease VII, small subunit [Leptospira inadai serovar Lyme str. 10]PNV76325.1 exodeoxyribonuclease VII small subunit [Leptospira inadai serovar Lyme]
MAKKTDISFEQALSELEQIAEKLERGQLTLEESIKAYERGMELRGLCQGILAEAEGKIEYLSKSTSGETQKKTAAPKSDGSTRTANPPAEDNELF